MIVYICVGNSDDKLGQRQWYDLWNEVSAAVHAWSVRVHGEWLSPPNEPWQNACWCVEVSEDGALVLRAALGAYARKYQQDSITWAPAERTDFL